MTEKIIQWGKLTPEEKDRCIHEKVMGNAPYVPCPGMVVNTKQPYTNPAGYSEWYIWKCDTCGEEYVSHRGNYTGHPRLPHNEYFAEKPEIPKYSESMDAAWLMFQKMMARYDGVSCYDDEVLNAFCVDLLRDRDEIYPAYSFLLEMAKWTPERLCLAALRAVGYRVEVA